MLQVATWFAFIHYDLGVDSTYAVESYAEPDAFGKAKDSGTPYHKNKWGRYLRGLNKPQARLVDAVDTRIPGSKALLSHVLWDAMRVRVNVSKLVKHGVQRLSPDIQRIVVNTNIIWETTGELRTDLGLRQYRMLERRAGIDALACLTMLLRKCAGLRDSEEVLAIARSLYHVLLISCTFEPFSLVAPFVYRIYREQIFPIAGVRLDAIDFAQVADMLGGAAAQILMDNDLRVGSDPRRHIRCMADILRGKHGADLVATFVPAVFVQGDKGPSWNTGSR